MRTKTGIISSKKMDKTIVVTVNSYRNHPKYKKRYRVSKKFYAHIENPEDFAEGDSVTIVETRPISKLKRWKVVSEKAVKS